MERFSDSSESQEDLTVMEEIRAKYNTYYEAAESLGNSFDKVYEQIDTLEFEVRKFAQRLESLQAKGAYPFEKKKDTESHNNAQRRKIKIRTLSNPEYDSMKIYRDDDDKINASLGMKRNASTLPFDLKSEKERAMAMTSGKSTVKKLLERKALLKGKSLSFTALVCKNPLLI